MNEDRYELSAGPAYTFAFDRREMFRVLGGGLAVALIAGDGIARQESGRGRGRGMPQDVRSWLHIAADGRVTVLTGKVEVGQNIRTSLAQVVAEELRVPLEAIDMVMGDTDLVPYDRGTFGSQSTPIMGPQLRRVAATAREVLLDIAAEHWGVERGDVSIDEGSVRNAGARVAPLPIGELVREASGAGGPIEGGEIVATIAEDPQLTEPGDWTVAGRSAAKVDGRAVVTGAHLYPSDVAEPDMLHGKVLRPPAFGATPASVDLSDAQAMPGVTAVHDGEFIGVAAPTEEAAARAIAAIRAEWSTTPQVGEQELFDHLVRSASAGGGRGSDSAGSIAAGMQSAAERREGRYTVAYIAHTPLEPRAAVARWQDGRLTVWTGTQRPFGVRTELAEAFRVAEDSVRVIMPDTGSGYGGKHTGETAVEAARLARAAGRPVKLVWTREEEFTWAYFRPAGVIRVAAGVDSGGALTAWEFHNYNSGGSGIRTPYRVANRDIRFHDSDSPLRQGSYRGLAATANHFAREAHMSELADAVGMDPLAFRLRNLTDERMIAVLEAAADAFGWSTRRSGEGNGCGIACGFEKGGYVASCAEVSVAERTGEVTVTRAVTAFECGKIINPDQLENQVEGGVVMGLGGALFEAIEFDDGRIRNARLSQYRVPRFSDMPDMRIVLLDRPDLPSAGAGETPIVAIAPAIAAAIFEATGTRLRSLPLVPNGLSETTAGRD